MIKWVCDIGKADISRIEQRFKSYIFNTWMSVISHVHQSFLLQTQAMRQKEASISNNCKRTTWKLFQLSIQAHLMAIDSRCLRVLDVKRKVEEYCWGYRQLRYRPRSQKLGEDFRKQLPEQPRSLKQWVCTEDTWQGWFGLCYYLHLEPKTLHYDAWYQVRLSRLHNIIVMLTMVIML